MFLSIIIIVVVIVSGTECPLHHRKSLEEDIFPVLIQEPVLPSDQWIA